MRLDGYSQSKKWNVVRVQIIPQRESKLCGYDDINLSNQCGSFLKVNFQKAYIAINKKVIEKFLIKFKGTHLSRKILQTMSAKSTKNATPVEDISLA